MSTPKFTKLIWFLLVFAIPFAFSSNAAEAQCRRTIWRHTRCCPCSRPPVNVKNHAYYVQIQSKNSSANTAIVTWTDRSTGLQLAQLQINAPQHASLTFRYIATNGRLENAKCTVQLVSVGPTIPADSWRIGSITTRKFVNNSPSGQWATWTFHQWTFNSGGSAQTDPYAVLH